MCLRVLGSYGMSFVSGPKPGRILLNFLKCPQAKNGKLGLISMTQKIKTIFDFFLTILKVKSCFIMKRYCTG